MFVSLQALHNLTPTMILLLSSESPSGLSMIDYGLAGFVIAGLIGVIWKIVTLFISSLKEITTEHREERKEWSAEATKRSDKTDDVIAKLTEAVLQSKQTLSKKD